MANSKILSRFGFRLDHGCTHISRTMMLEDLRTLLSCVSSHDAEKKDYLKAIVADNCLGKRSGRNRKLTAKHLVELYSLDPSVNIFRTLLYFWRRDAEGQPLLALLCAYARDPILRKSAPLILNLPEGAATDRTEMEEHIKKRYPDRFSKVTVESTAQHLNSTWTKSRHLEGKAIKRRKKALPTAGAASFAIFLGYLTGIRGETLLTSEFVKLLDCPPDRTMELAEEASRRGWIVFKRIGKIIEAQFPNLLTRQEMEWLNER
ncbi:MAG: hypothetical protein FJ088_10140 [Deltaproteobacteria bacterium]|nr:hypothetical protein [Deltaproteobacteria bacterium]